MRRRMGDSRFNIPAAIRSGYLFVGREWQYLARAGLLPLGVSLITELLMYHQKREFSFFEDFLWHLPALTLFGWLMFVEARLLLLGERAGYLQGDPAYLSERQRALWACVLVWVLFIMARTSLFAYIAWGTDKSNPLVRFSWLFLFGAGIWAIRFYVAPILAAVGYPIRRYIFQVNGILISLRLAALYLMTCMPVAVLEYGMRTLILPEEAKDKLVEQEMLGMLPESTATTLITLDAFADLAAMLLLTAVFSYALKEILGRPRQEKAA